MNLLITLFAALAAGSCIRMVASRRANADTRSQRLASLRTWWVLAGMFAIAVCVGRLGACIFLCAASVLALLEFMTVAAIPDGGRRTSCLVVSFVIFHYLCVYAEWHVGIVAVLPIALPVALATLHIVSGVTAGYIRATAGVSWAALTLAYGVSHAFMLIPASGTGLASYRWLLYLVMLTEIDDIAQAVVGRRFGRRRITPKISPNKTWEGLFGGAAATIITAVALTALPGAVATHAGESVPVFWAAVSGLLICITGFMGDLNMSAVKRDGGVKDSSKRLPGMGGVIDRIDSLSFTAPAFYYFLTRTLP